MECSICLHNINRLSIMDGITMEDDFYIYIEKCQTCNQLFHIDCIDRWLNINNSCAHCRGKFKTIYIKYWSNGGIMFEFNENVETRYWSNGNLKCKIYFDDNGNIIRGIYHTSRHTSTYNILDFPLDVIDDIREDDFYIYIEDYYSLN